MFPLTIKSADTDQVITVSLRHGSAHAALGADDDLEYLVRRLRAAWTQVVLRIRGDAGCGVPWMYAVCERLDVDYTFGLSANAVLQRETEEMQAEAVRRFQETGQPQRLFTAFWSGGHLASAAVGDWPRSRPTPWAPTVASWSAIGLAPASWSKAPTTTTPCAARAKTATRN